MDKESAWYYLAELECEYKMSIYNEWIDNKGKERIYQQWRVIPASIVQREYKNAAIIGIVNDKNIEKICNVCIENYLKLYINTILFGHDSINPYSYMEDVIPEDMTETEFEELFIDFEWFACDKDGNWRISDYGLSRIGNAIIGILCATSSEEKLYYVDCILNVIHQRSDLSSWFIEGGSSMLDELFIKNYVAVQ